MDEGKGPGTNWIGMDNLSVRNELVILVWIHR